MSRRIRWGILGNAEIAVKCVIPAISKSKNGRIHALASGKRKEAEGVAKKYEISNVYDHYEQVINDPEVDAVYIPLPNHLHLPWTIKALNAGKHVLCEKPLARNEAEAREMAHAAKAAGCCLMEAMMYRFHPRNLAVHEMIQTGCIGDPRLVRAAFCFHLGEDGLERVDNFRLSREKGGGALMDVGCYGVSIARWLMGREPLSVQATAHWHESGVDIHSAGVLMFPDYGIAIVEASFISALQQTYTVVGADGAIELPHNAYIPWEADALFFVRERNEEKGRKMIIPGADEYQLMVEHFADVLLSGGSLRLTLEDSIHNLIVLDALAKSARSGRAIDLGEIPCAAKRD